MTDKKEIYAFENKYNIKLPEAYINALMQGDNKLYDLNTIAKYMKLTMKWHEYKMNEVRLNEDFPIDMEMVRKMSDARKLGTYGGYDIYFTLDRNIYLEENRQPEWYELDALIKGWIPILSLGCAYEMILVLSGDLKGHVFSMNGDDGVEVVHIGPFEEWFENFKLKY
ncbi:SMI1/KNR4 family protein [Clostridium lundense]|uniref:SMI1/KNR4 family protein n=1 Tax=Clostridium lundense TaxID=319475 RepID=UPI0004852265|nr:SMI1/KNR4 family protein [Clostridium lundense]